MGLRVCTAAPPPPPSHLYPHSTHLPELLQLVDLLGSDLACTELLLLRGDLHQPGQEAAVLDEGLPLGAVPVDVLQAALAGTWLPADGGSSGDRPERGGVSWTFICSLKKVPHHLPGVHTGHTIHNTLHNKHEIALIYTKLHQCTLIPAEQHHHRVSLGGDEAQQEDIAAAAVVALQHRLAQRPILVQRHLLALGPHQVVHDVARDTRRHKLQ